MNTQQKQTSEAINTIVPSTDDIHRYRREREREIENGKEQHILQLC